MGIERIPLVYLCPRCLLSEAQPGSCARCGGERVRCCPGEPDDPGRRPLLDREGKVQTRAPVWWLRHTVARLMLLREGRQEADSRSRAER